jgi:hypothetical protein
MDTQTDRDLIVEVNFEVANVGVLCRHEKATFR